MSDEPLRADHGFASVQRIIGDVLDDLGPDDHLAVRLAIVRYLLHGLHRTATAGPLADAADCDDELDLLGIRPCDWQDADRRLEQFVVRHGADRERDIVQLLSRRNRRQIDLSSRGCASSEDFARSPSTGRSFRPRKGRMELVHCG